MKNPSGIFRKRGMRSDRRVHSLQNVLDDICRRLFRVLSQDRFVQVQALRLATLLVLRSLWLRVDLVHRRRRRRRSVFRIGYLHKRSAVVASLLLLLLSTGTATKTLLAIKGDWWRLRSMQRGLAMTSRGRRVVGAVIIIIIVVVIVIVVVDQQEFLAPCRFQLHAMRKHFFGRGYKQLGGYEGRLEDGRQSSIYIRNTYRTRLVRREREREGRGRKFLNRGEKKWIETGGEGTYFMISSKSKAARAVNPPWTAS